MFCKPRLQVTLYLVEKEPIPGFFLLDRIGLQFRRNGSRFQSSDIHVSSPVYQTGGVYVLLHLEVTPNPYLSCVLGKI